MGQREVLTVHAFFRPVMSLPNDGVALENSIMMSQNGGQKNPFR